METDLEEDLMQLLGKIQRKESQLKLLQMTVHDNELLHSKIVSSVQPKIGMMFMHDDLEERKVELMNKLRKDILQLSVEEKHKEITTLKSEFKSKRKTYDESSNNQYDFYVKLEKKSNLIAKEINKRMNKKVLFHKENSNFNIFSSRRIFEKKRVCKKSKRRRQINRKKYRTKCREKIKNKIRTLIENIKEENIVINLSTLEIPDSAMLYLAKGLGFVKSNKVDKHDLKFDALEFLRKVEWKVFFKENPELLTDEVDKHKDLRVNNGKSPNMQHPLLEDIKTRLLGWIANHEVKTPKQNFTQLEMRGRRWVIDQIKSRNIFITKADKGGATLILNFDDVTTAIETEILNTDKFEKIANDSDKHLSDIMNRVISLTKKLGEKEMLTTRDKKLICGLNENNNLSLNPAYKAEPPYAYPLFKLHKLTENQIREKVVPPYRLVHASKFGPLYRLEKWCSPYLTEISQAYCKAEFLLDTNDLLKQIDDLNKENSFRNDHINLFTLDVEKLYPSIQPDKALQAVQHTLSEDVKTEKRIKDSLITLIEFCFNESYITYNNSCFRGKVGIPTGGCISRQIADIFLHYVLFVQSEVKIDNIHEIPFWKRFIDDCLGIWRGTERQFMNFVKKLNVEAKKFGIHFPVSEIQFGKSVNFLDVSLYLDEGNNIQYKGYTKPTDAKRFLKPQSFHPHHVFSSVPTSQMIRVFNRNSETVNYDRDLISLKKDFVNSGYKAEVLDKIELDLKRQRTAIDIDTTRPKYDSLTFSIFYFDGIVEFKKLIHELEDDFKSIMGEVKIVFAIKKGKSIGNSVVKNKSLCFDVDTHAPNQKCNAGGCLQCPLVVNTRKMVINNKTILIPGNLNCKSNNVVYLWRCKICNVENCYFGRTTQKCHMRTNGHRDCFNSENFSKSALSMHARDEHTDDISLGNFEIAIVKQIPPRNIKREEFRFIDKYRTQSLGMNRYKV